jgi:hypothetical protein
MEFLFRDFARRAEKDAESHRRVENRFDRRVSNDPTRHEPRDGVGREELPERPSATPLHAVGECVFGRIGELRVGS